MTLMFKRLTALSLMLLILFAAMAPAMAADPVTPVTETQVMYLDGPTGTKCNISCQLAYGTKAFTIKRANVKVTPGGTGAKLISFDKYQSNDAYEDYSVDNDKWSTYKYFHCSYQARLRITKPGTATVSYKIGTKTYKTKVKVLAYANPVKTITLTGVNGGRNFASFTKTGKSPSKPLTLKADVAKAVLKIKTASGWKITDVYFSDYDQDAGISRSVSCGKTAGTVTLTVGALYASGHDCHFSVTFKNTATGGVMNLYYYLSK